MREQAAATAGVEALEFVARPNWLTLALAIVPTLAVFQSLYVLIVKPVPVVLILLLVGVIGACGLLALKAFEGVLPTNVELAADGVDVSRAFGKQSFKWNEIEDIKLVPAPGTIADDPNRSSANRIGIGLFLKETAKSREDNNLADVVLFVGTDDDTAQLLGIMERIAAARARKLGPAGGKAPAKIGARRAAPRPAAQFRRSPDGAQG